MTTAARRAAYVLTFALFALLALQGAARAVEAPKDLVPKASCTSTTCHPGFAKKKHVHGPVSVGECDSCHVWKNNKHSFTLAEKSPKLCVGCHDDMDFPKKGEKKEPAKKEAGAKPAKLFVHEPVAEDCLTCHDAHASDYKAHLISSVVELCGTCHDEELDKAKSKTAVSRHTAVFEGKACLSCHKPHSSKFAKLLPAAPMDTCLKCHDKPLEAGGRTIANLKEEITTHKVVHAPVQDKECLPCHTPHGSKLPSLLTATYPETFYAPFGVKAYALCFSCHDDALATKEQTKDTEFRNGERNLHYVHVHKDPKGRTCRDCHAAHASDQPFQLHASVPFGRIGWKLPIGYAKTASGGTCNPGCHAPKTYDRKSPVKYE